MGKRNGLKKCVFFKRTDLAPSEDETLNVCWEEVKWWEVDQLNIVEEIPNFKILQYNVLYDDMQNEEFSTRIFSKKRFDYILHSLLPNSMADVICLNEVGDTFLKRLLDECSSTWMKTGGYNYISHVDRERFNNLPSSAVFETMKKKDIDDSVHMTVEKGLFTNLIISKVPFLQSHNYYFQNDLLYSRRPVNLVTLSNDIVVANLHLKAYLECFETRKKQLKCLYSLFKIPRVAFSLHDSKSTEDTAAVVEEVQASESPVTTTKKTKQKSNKSKKPNHDASQMTEENKFTYHFLIEDSKNYPDKKEFLEIYEQRIKAVIMCGDFNLNHPFEEEYLKDYAVEDVYAQLHAELVAKKDISTLTFDYLNNPIVNLFSTESRGRCRFDRVVLYRVKDKDHIQPQSCTVIENKPFEADIYGSDHFGLLSQFEICKR